MNAHAKAATRARLLGNLVRGRAMIHPQRRAYEAAARHLHDASAALLDSTDDLTGQLDDATKAALKAARRCLAATDVPTILLPYVTAPVTGELPTLPALDLPHSTTRAHANSLRAWRLGALDRINDCNDEMAMAALDALIDVHRGWADLVHALYSDAA
ncbi:hypothetical protein HUT18_11740 [Streptomyces sp. NA04227]|uniref:hypothetical protein n=1 Tax=Streptomyces sp. NA04227 TaxID=2742136 RepID=UPI00159060A1|nr:hypothetical protein [Streptomyces sp. NA04227]QKW06970.1 hypothetical protein HUT18_11740 [Streptomyces sp. NA04227]